MCILQDNLSNLIQNNLKRNKLDNLKDRASYKLLHKPKVQMKCRCSHLSDSCTYNSKSQYLSRQPLHLKRTLMPCMYQQGTKLVSKYRLHNNAPEYTERIQSKFGHRMQDCTSQQHMGIRQMRWSPQDNKTLVDSVQSYRIGRRHNNIPQNMLYIDLDRIDWLR